MIASLPVTGVEAIITQMKDMKVTPQTLDLTLRPTITEGIFILKEGLELPFLPIPSPSNLNSWSQAFPAATNTQGGASASREGPSNLGQTTQGLLPEQVRILGTTPFYTTFQPVSSVPPSGCFIGIPKQDQALEGNRSNSEDIGLEEGEQAAKTRPKQPRNQGIQKSEKGIGN